MNTEYYLFFYSGPLHYRTHYQWSDALRAAGLPFNVVTTGLNSWRQTYKSEIRCYLKDPTRRFFCARNGILAKLKAYFFFLGRLLSGKKLVLYLWKQPALPFIILQKLFRKRLWFAVELEGDSLEEFKYAKENPYKPRFYDQYFATMKGILKRMVKEFRHARKIVVYSESFKHRLITRYPELQMDKEIVVRESVGADTLSFFHDENLRDEYRSKLNMQQKFILLFSGNLFSSYQNISGNLRFFKLIKECCIPNAHLLLLVPNKDHSIAHDFIKRFELQQEDFTLMQAAHHEMNGYINAADLGLLLRKSHPMHSAAIPSKFAESMACGLPMIVSCDIGDLRPKLEELKLMPLINDMYDEEEIMSKIKPFLKHDPHLRQCIRQEIAVNLLGVERHINSMLEVFSEA